MRGICRARMVSRRQVHVQVQFWRNPQRELRCTGAIADSVNYTVEELRSLVANVQNTA